MPLATWARLERLPAGDLPVDAAEDVAGKLAAIARAQREGRVDAGSEPAEIYSMVIALWPVRSAGPSLRRTGRPARDAARG